MDSFNLVHKGIFYPMSPYMVQHVFRREFVNCNKLHLPSDVNEAAVQAFYLGLIQGNWNAVETKVPRPINPELLGLVSYFCLPNEAEKFTTRFTKEETKAAIFHHYKAWNEGTWKALAFLFQGTPEIFGVLELFGKEGMPQMWEAATQFVNQEQPYKFNTAANGATNDNEVLQASLNMSFPDLTSPTFLSQNANSDGRSINTHVSLNVSLATSTPSKSSAPETCIEIPGNGANQQASLNQLILEPVPSTSTAVYATAPNCDGNQSTRTIDSEAFVNVADDLFEISDAKVLIRQPDETDVSNSASDSSSDSLFVKIKKCKTSVSTSTLRSNSKANAPKSKKGATTKKDSQVSSSSVHARSLRGFRSPPSQPESDEHSPRQTRSMEKPQAKTTNPNTVYSCRTGPELERLVATAEKGTTIRLQANVEYKLSGTLFLKKTKIQILGDGLGCRISGDNSEDPIIDIHPGANKCVLSNFEIISHSVGNSVRIGLFLCSQENKVENVRIINSNLCIWTSWNQLKDVEVLMQTDAKKSEWAIKIEKSEHNFKGVPREMPQGNVLENLTVRDFEFGLELKMCKNNVVKRLKTVDVMYGLTLDNSDENTVKAVQFEWNKKMPLNAKKTDMPGAVQILGGKANRVEGVSCKVKGGKEDGVYKYYWGKVAKEGHDLGPPESNVFTDCEGPGLFIDKRYFQTIKARCFETKNC